MANERIETEDAPAAIGPYSQAIRSGDWLFCSGQIPLDPATGTMVGEDDVQAQTKQVLRNLDAVLSEAGAKKSQVTKATVYLLDMGEFSKVNEVYAAYFDQAAPPARACIQAAALPRGARVEIDFIVHLAP